MEKYREHKREISFMSVKDLQMKTVQDNDALRFAKTLETNERVARYDTQIVLDGWKHNISLCGIRTEFRDVMWVTDFLVEYTDGSREVFELVSIRKATKAAEIEKLEISRRYWKSANIGRWRIVFREEISG